MILVDSGSPEPGYPDGGASSIPELFSAALLVMPEQCPIMRPEQEGNLGLVLTDCEVGGTGGSCLYVAHYSVVITE